ncbi:hypothetical protein SCA6_019048 [Theobroma cacao]
MKHRGQPPNSKSKANPKIPANSNHSDAMSTSDPNRLISKAEKLTKLSLTRWSADRKSTTVSYEQAVNAI